MNYKSCGNCSQEETCRLYFDCYDLNNEFVYWEKIPCPHCGGILSEIRHNADKSYRHCYQCHFEWEVNYGA